MIQKYIEFVLNYKEIHPLRFWGISILIVLSIVLVIWLIVRNIKSKRLKSVVDNPITKVAETPTISNYQSEDNDNKEHDENKESVKIKKTIETRVMPEEPKKQIPTSIVKPEEPKKQLPTSIVKPEEPKKQLPTSIPETPVSITDNLFVEYFPSLKFIQILPWKYPVVKFPKNKCIVRSHRIGSTKRRGYKEPFFEATLDKYFSSDFDVSGQVRLNTGKETRPYEPDIALLDKKSGLNIRIDIEIDEPYAGLSRQATHCIGEDDLRDLFFAERGWIVVRFTEYQVHVQELECIAYIFNIINSISKAISIERSLQTIVFPTVENQWDIIQAQKWEKEKYRENYLGHEFGEVPEQTETANRDLSIQEIEEEKFVENIVIGVVEESQFTGCNKLNIHPRDKRINFYPEKHVYTIDGVVAPSASTIVSKFFPEFDKYYWSDRKAAELGMSPKAVIEMWENKAKTAREEGTKLHKQIENYYLGLEYIETNEFYQFKEFLNDHKHLNPFRTEWKIFDEKYHFAGTIDFIVKNDNYYELYDWKRSTKVVNLFDGTPLKSNPWQTGVGNLNHIDDTSYNRYTLQQSLYRYILETRYKLKISRMFLLIMHPDYKRYFKVEVPYLKDETIFMLETL